MIIDTNTQVVKTWGLLPVIVMDRTYLLYNGNTLRIYTLKQTHAQ